MTEREAFIEAIAANPGDDTARLAFADWLQERGEEARAEFIRLQCALALRSPPDEQYELAYSHYPTFANNEDARAAELLTEHWPEWFGPVLSAVGMPKPGAAVAPQQAGEVLRYPPYAVYSHWQLLRHLPIVFEREFSSNSRRANTPKRFLNSLRLDRGFVVGLNVSLANCEPRSALAAALRIEPITALALRLSSEARHWEQLSHPSLARVRDLELTLSDVLSSAQFPVAADSILDDPALGGVRALALLSEHEFEEEYDSPLLLSRTEMEVLLGSAVARRLHALRTGIDWGGAVALSDAEPLLGLRALSLTCLTGGRPMALPLHEYRNRLEQLTLSGAFEVRTLCHGRPWLRLTDLRLSESQVGEPECQALAEPGQFPALTRLRIMSSGVASVRLARALATALRAGRFTNLTALSILGHMSGSLVALAEAVAPTGIRELDLRGTRVDLQTEYDRVRELLGDRVRIDPPSDPLGDDPIPF